MADRKVRVLRAFNGIGQDQDAAEKQRYFTPSNEDTAEEFLSKEEFDYRVEQGFLSVEEVKEPEPLRFTAPQPEGTTAEAATSGSRRRRPAVTGQE